MGVGRVGGGCVNGGGHSMRMIRVGVGVCVHRMGVVRI